MKWSVKGSNATKRYRINDKENRKSEIDEGRKVRETSEAGWRWRLCMY